MTTMAPQVPQYLQDTYYWAYINPRNVKWLDNDFVVRTILWQQHNRLQKLAFAEIEFGDDVLQTACVYGSFSLNLAKWIGLGGTLDIVDAAAIQVRNTRVKLKNYRNARVYQNDVLALSPNETHDVVCCYFLLHELPDLQKYEAVRLFLKKVKPGGKAVFVDYHKPKWWHPLKLITSIVFDTLEPFAKGLWRNEIKEFSFRADDEFTWTKETIFGGLFQKVVATRK